MLSSFFCVGLPMEDLNSRCALFDGLAIAEEEVFFKKHFAAYPVIHLSFKASLFASQ